MKMAIVPRLVQVAGELAQRLAHEPGLQAHVAVAHLAFDLGPGHEGRHGVDDEHVERTRADQHVGDLEALLTRVGLADQEIVDVHADRPAVHRVHGVLGVDVGARSTVALRLGDHVHGERRLTRRLRAEDLDDPAPGKSADTEREVERERTRGDGFDADVAPLAQLHDRALAELLVDLGECHIECLLAVHCETPFLPLRPCRRWRGSRRART